MADRCKSLSKDEKGKHTPNSVNAGTQLCWATSNAQGPWSTSGIWIDAGATSHMFGDSQLLKSSTPLNPPQKVYFGDGSFIEATAVGDANIKTKVGSQTFNVSVKKVLLVPALKTNFLSLNQIMKDGKFSATFEGKKMNIVHGASGIKVAAAEVSPDNNLYRLVMNSNQSLYSLSSQADLKLWHRRMGHLNGNDLKLALRWKQTDNLEMCRSCMEGKMHRNAFPMSTSRAKDVLELVHSDVCGPLNKETFGGARYFVTFIDDKSRKVWVHTMHRRSEVFELFKEFKAAMENMTCKKIKVLRSDNGGEYSSSAMRDYLKRCGI